ncbi:alpha/beta hydrolase [Stackebrandtia nassauensis]|uniref:TAP domain protein n=1 Tax=Stackebrandtia nassauensis (strain DSM 44728 / CIP 108903 / NRRL B-16338 / NBRC 102104 / LLR-40K-21) TaxID=446470 RepID=D3Q1D5_STANL|nr:alpha/beta hydrolase [Stackebrandtia nassauensis]ADD45715.1 TAP domain protein [Stackebrandtia nassauensis DSM 44728]
MKRSLRMVGIAAVAALAMGTAIVATQTASAEPTAKIAWKPCKDAEGKVYCATIKVPLDYSDPHGEKIKIGLAKRPATKPDKRIGALVVNPGGPGGSGVDMVKNTTVGSKKMQERFDLIGFDPRGINTSTQIKCEEADIEATFDIGLPTTKKKFTKLAKANKKLADGCRKLTGPLFDHADNLHVVRDIEVIRKSLGEKKLNFLGYSYGTLMGQQYAEKYPTKIRSMVLDGNMDHSLESTYAFASTETGAVERNFNEFAKWCDSDKKCALSGKTAKVYGELRELAKAGKLVDEGEKLDFYEFSDYYGFAVNEPGYWGELAKELKALKAGQPKQNKLKSASDRAAVEYVFQSMFCADWGLGLKNFDEWKQLNADLAKEHPNTQWSSYNANIAGCVGDPVGYTNKRKPLEIEGAPPLVMIGNLGDYATVYPWSQVAAEQSGATLITYEGYGHTIYGGGYSCIDKPVESYFIDLKKPADGISCDSLETPGKSTKDRTGDVAGVGPYSLN